MEFTNILEKVNNYREGRVLIAAVELDLFTCIGDGATLDEVSDRMETDFRSTHMMLDALTAVGMLEREGILYKNTPVSRDYLSAGGANDARALLNYQNELWHRWTHLSTCLRTTSCHVCERYRAQGPEWWQTFTRAMLVCSSQRAPKVMASIDLTGVQSLLELSGGGGGYAIAFAKAFPELAATVLDESSVLNIARAAIRKAGLTERISVLEGEPATTGWAGPYDLVYLPNLCQRYSAATNRDLIAKARTAVKPGGRIIIEDYVMSDDRLTPVQGALTALGMILNTREGGTYTRTEFTDWLQKAGFTNIEFIGLAGVETDIMTAQNPA